MVVKYGYSDTMRNSDKLCEHINSFFYENMFQNDSEILKF